MFSSDRSRVLSRPRWCCKRTAVVFIREGGGILSRLRCYSFMRVVVFPVSVYAR